jgi:hypothetical protein
MELTTILNRCHHFRGLSMSAPVLELALYHSLGKLPEPESTHDFF